MLRGLNGHRSTWDRRVSRMMSKLSDKTSLWVGGVVCNTIGLNELLRVQIDHSKKHEGLMVHEAYVVFNPKDGEHDPVEGHGTGPTEQEAFLEAVRGLREEMLRKNYAPVPFFQHYDAGSYGPDSLVEELEIANQGDGALLGTRDRLTLIRVL